MVEGAEDGEIEENEAGGEGEDFPAQRGEKEAEGGEEIEGELERECGAVERMSAERGAGGE